MSALDGLTGAEVVGIIAGSNVLAVGVGAWLSRRRDTFAVFTDAYEKLAVRVTALETKLESVEAKLGAEKEAHTLERVAHEQTKSLLRMAVVHIRAVMNWAAGERANPIPVPPAELMVHS